MVTIASLGTNVVMRRVQRMNDAQSHAGNTVNNPRITGEFSKPEKSKLYPWKPYTADSRERRVKRKLFRVPTTRSLRDAVVTDTPSTD